MFVSMPDVGLGQNAEGVLLKVELVLCASAGCG